MKVKLLKKLRKRFLWYYEKSIPYSSDFTRNRLVIFDRKTQLYLHETTIPDIRIIPVMLNIMKMPEFVKIYWLKLADKRYSDTKKLNAKFNTLTHEKI